MRRAAGGIGTPDRVAIADTLGVGKSERPPLGVVEGAGVPVAAVVDEIGDPLIALGADEGEGVAAGVHAMTTNASAMSRRTRPTVSRVGWNDSRRPSARD
ncbi:MAG TPA: hypothetical protein VGS17_14570 [Candidatus Limnocylindria bacterium]|nr:hypothetical protein [Candidatus Limnocylindria bacterium]